MNIFVVLILNTSFVYTAYFSMRNIKVNIPGDKAKFHLAHYPIVTLYAQETTTNADRHFQFSINGSKGYLEVYPTTGDVRFTSKFIQSIKELDTISSYISVEDSQGNSDSVSLQILITQSEHLNCDLILDSLCFWPAIKYRIYEAFKPTSLGSLASPYHAKMCPDYKTNYTIHKDSNEFKLEPPSSTNKYWTIGSSVPLHRESQGDQVALKIKCRVENKQGSIREIPKDILIEIVEQDNHLPISQENEIQLNFSTTYFEKGHIVEPHQLIFTDKDSPDVNHYNPTVIEHDTNLLQPNCVKYTDTREGLNQTAVHCKFNFTKSKKFTKPSYSFELLLNDTSFKGFNNGTVTRLPILFNFIKPSNLVAPHHPLILYPLEEVNIFRTAAPFARISQPTNFRGYSEFQIKEDSTINILNITKDEGIIFVHDYNELRKLNKDFINVNISWDKQGKSEFDLIRVRIVNESKRTCNSPSFWTQCSEYRTYNECINITSCAISTGGSYSVVMRNRPQRCMWRGDKIPGAEETTLYSTCTPDASKCPDGICDSLEKLNHRICPQDCTDKTHFLTSLNPLTGRGIASAIGTCFCDQLGSCTCELPKKKIKSTTISPSPSTLNNSRQTGNFSKQFLGVELAKCETNCVLGIIAAIFCLGGVVAITLICWRLDNVKKASRNKNNDDSQDMMVAPLSDYVDRNLNSDPLSINFQMTTSLTNNGTQHFLKKYEHDPKWEFPRSQLIIEQTLGEGEFGRVLKAKATDIAGEVGCKTVAVKTLKNDAREAELNDLLSEYHLLREVSHPNVIRLLGVCTVSGGPIYLIIEYAEYGSLRTYLRRSRLLKSENASLSLENNDIHYDEPNVSKITPKEIISFAWQISNGMGYLSDIKLVHRDLAARNVLLASDKVCKVSDFGLTRDIYEDNAYFKKSKGRVPVKWMAPESLADHIYTTKSDVWSFGILIWELLTLGATPYPGIAVQNLFHLLRQGYRMERPDNCSPALYKIMRSCWDIDPEARPSFQQLSHCWERMLGDGIEYLELSNTSIHNRSYFCSEFGDFQENELPEKPNGNSVNYLNKSKSYQKCGASNKIVYEASKTDSTESLCIKGYETPVKVSENLHTPTNESPEEYTDMQSKI